MSNIAKRHISTQKLLGEYLTFVPQQRLVDAFATDMKTLHPTLLRDSIREAVQTRQVQTIPHAQQRAAIHRIYHRKIKEFSSLYPFIFAVENGLRSAVADHLEAVFGRMDWWTLLRDAWLAGRPPTDFTHIRTVPVKPRFVKSVFFAFGELGVEGTSNIAGPDKSDELYYEISFGQLIRLIQSDWNLTRDMFLPDAQLGYRLRSTAFDDDAGIIKVGRNAIFHSNPIKNRSQFVGACERVLDTLAFHLGDYDQDMAGVTFTRIQESIARGPRHVIPPR